MDSQTTEQLIQILAYILIPVVIIVKKNIKRIKQMDVEEKGQE